MESNQSIVTFKPQPRRRTSKGRQKIEIKKVERENSRYVTFSKRKNGIFKKAAEISTLCGAEVAVVLFSEHGKVFSYGEPDVDKLIDRYLDSELELEVEKSKHSLNSEPESNVSQIRASQEREYSRAVTMIGKLKSSLKMAEQSRNSVMSNGGEVFWWELPIEESMEEEELQGYKESLEELKKNVMNRIEAISACDESRMINQFIYNHNEGYGSNNNYNYNYNYSLHGSIFTPDQFSSFNNGGSF